MRDTGGADTLQVHASVQGACEAAITALEARTAKLQQWAAVSTQVGSQEIQQLEAAVAALQQQQQQLQQHRMETLPAIEKAAVSEIKELRKERDTLVSRMRCEGDKLIESLSLFYENKEKSWGTAVASDKAKERCADLWASLAQVKSTRKSAAEVLTAKLNDALGEAEKAICEEAASRRQAEEALNK
ncbi:hypothetical protein, conserved [Eimeria acervulina]|uniref:Uncharacterized protein n=1 Tax=Eimeria acervulina TaxID=5801 RepID=U6GQN1_EIMAC|nr:hypothetical protein, conserved [Eimeria acervulina]CDI81892.1 hypothetical protein, conserved [Eimeria acervulina]